jgi:hypothetical protein
MPRCAASFVIAAYFYVRRIPQELRALPANLLRNHHNFDFLQVHQGLIDRFQGKEASSP